MNYENKLSFWLISWISFFIIFHSTIVIFAGLGWLNFIGYEWLLKWIMGADFLQMVAMGIVVRLYIKEIDYEHVK